MNDTKQEKKLMVVPDEPKPEAGVVERTEPISEGEALAMIEEQLALGLEETVESFTQELIKLPGGVERRSLENLIKVGQKMLIGLRREAMQIRKLESVKQCRIIKPGEHGVPPGYRALTDAQALSMLKKKH